MGVEQLAFLDVLSERPESFLQSELNKVNLSGSLR
jgi:hypothetical protein